ncbi:MAG TPA: cyclic nucleotide-binding domain-containing protein [Burkholderiales bacterium]|nr:cyclic nucleotide-binding domain-containing protein [Burkholderiales bacterium]
MLNCNQHGLGAAGDLCEIPFVVDCGVPRNRFREKGGQTQGLVNYAQRAGGALLMAEKADSINKRLATLENLGEATVVAEQIFGMVGNSTFFSELNREDVGKLASFMQVYRARPGEIIIQEGDPGDYMLLLIQGQVDIFKKGRRGDELHMTLVLPGMTIGEMSMIDGEPRFATCVAKEPSIFAVLTRDNMVKIVLDQPKLGAKILIKLVTLLSQRLRQTSQKLLDYMVR